MPEFKSVGFESAPEQFVTTIGLMRDAVSRHEYDSIVLSPPSTKRYHTFLMGGRHGLQNISHMSQQGLPNIFQFAFECGPSVFQMVVRYDDDMM